ncbi:hypothetical protein [Neobacillus cucumis]|uniref:Uncharacterized protein n=1 Tax=Neobacillus cucumis TaxID=1740721 RepID=A0A2N5H9Y3_9BACI|nr:hypothetical protein [Neobacillus cucumis]PLS02329.1 hypothetical protein CVD27_20325 [Neobacillus cucumis]
MNNRFILKTVIPLMLVLTACGGHQTIHKKPAETTNSEMETENTKKFQAVKLKKLNPGSPNERAVLKKQCEQNQKNCLEFALKQIDATIASAEKDSKTLTIRDDAAYRKYVYPYLFEADLADQHLYEKGKKAGVRSKQYSSYVKRELIDNPQNDMLALLKALKDVRYPENRKDFHETLLSYGRDLYRLYALQYYAGLAGKNREPLDSKIDDLIFSKRSEHGYLEETLYPKTEGSGDTYGYGEITAGVKTSVKNKKALFSWDMFDTEGKDYPMSILIDSEKISGTDEQTQIHEGEFSFGLLESGTDDLYIQDTKIGHWSYSQASENIRRMDPFIIAASQLQEEWRAKLFYLHHGRVMQVFTPDGKDLFDFNYGAIRALAGNRFMTARFHDETDGIILETYAVDFNTGKTSLVNKREYRADETEFELNFYFNKQQP